MEKDFNLITFNLKDLSINFEGDEEKERIRKLKLPIKLWCLNNNVATKENPMPSNFLFYVTGFGQISQIKRFNIRGKSVDSIIHLITDIHKSNYTESCLRCGSKNILREPQDYEYKKYEIFFLFRSDKKCCSILIEKLATMYKNFLDYTNEDKYHSCITCNGLYFKDSGYENSKTYCKKCFRISNITTNQQNKDNHDKCINCDKLYLKNSGYIKSRTCSEKCFEISNVMRNKQDAHGEKIRKMINDEKGNIIHCCVCGDEDNVIYSQKYDRHICQGCIRCQKLLYGTVF